MINENIPNVVEQLNYQLSPFMYASVRVGWGVFSVFLCVRGGGVNSKFLSSCEETPSRHREG